jgi:hypothetical protein
MMKFIHKDNEDEETVSEELWLLANDYKSFAQFSQSNLIQYRYFIPLWESDYKHYLFLKDLWKKIALQMVKDGYLKEEDLEWKI